MSAGKATEASALGGRKADIAVRRRLSGSAEVIAVDPGGTTGWAVVTVPAGVLDGSGESGAAPIMRSVSYWTAGQFSGDENRMARSVVELAEAWEGATVVIEDFVLGQYNMRRELLSPVRVTAAIRYGLFVSDNRPVFLQSAGDAKRTCSDERLKRWGFLTETTGTPHARDAVRHALTFLRRAKLNESCRKSAWPELY